MTTERRPSTGSFRWCPTRPAPSCTPSGSTATQFRIGLPVMREHVRPIYVRLGIIPEVARGIQAVTHQTTPPTNGHDDDD